MNFKSLCLGSMLITSALANTSSVAVDVSNATVSDHDISHVNHQKSITFKTPAGLYGVTRFNISIFPQIAGNNDVLPISLDATLTKISNKNTADVFIQKLYAAAIKPTLVMSSLTDEMLEGKSSFPSQIDIQLRAALSMNNFEKDVSVFLKEIQENFDLDDASIQELRTFLSQHTPQ